MEINIFANSFQNSNEPMNTSIKQVAIIGGGPAGSTLAIKLMRAGIRTAIFDIGKRPELIVGESLIPAVLPIIRDLGVEEEIKPFSVLKPGASVWLGDDEEAKGEYRRASGKLPDYCYHVERDKFDEVLLKAAIKEGARLFRFRANLEKCLGEKEIRLTNDTLQQTVGFFEGEPDLIIDATGRTRLISKLLNLKYRIGERKDWALFAHVDQAEMCEDGHVHLHRCEHGWSWRIPLPGKASVGIVVDPKHLEMYGDSVEEQFDNYLKNEPGISKFAKDSVRLSGVMKYNNYQSISEKMVGKGWALAGDAAGFLDPVFSSGVYLAMKSGMELAAAIIDGTPKAIAGYEKMWRKELHLWQKMVASWYNGRLFTLFRLGQDMMKNPVGRAIEPHMAGQLTQIFTGGAIDSIYSRNFLQFATGKLLDMMKWVGLNKRNPRELVIN